MKLTKYMVVGCIFAGICSAGLAQADSFTIDDTWGSSVPGEAPGPAGTYWGGQVKLGGVLNPSTKDTIGEQSNFDVSSLTVDRTTDSFTATFTGDYFSYYTNNPNTEYKFGDLFISTDGWNPDPSPDGHYSNDFASFGTDTSDPSNPVAATGNGEDWEYVFKLDSNGGTQGTVSLYQVSPNGDIIFPQEALTPQGMRLWQEYQYDIASGQVAEESALTTGALGLWNVQNGVFTITMSGFSLAQYDLDGEIGVHWTMACGNDVVEGVGGQVPEPATMLLFGAGLAGLAGVRSRKKK